MPKLNAVLVGILAFQICHEVIASRAWVAAAEPANVGVTHANGAIQAIKEEDVPGVLALCKWSEKEMDPQALEQEHKELLKYTVVNLLYFEGAPFVLFALDSQGKVIRKWRICVKTEKIPGLSAGKVEPPIFEDNIPTLKGLATTCPAQHPGPAECKAALATALSERQLEAIGFVRVTNIPTDSDAPTHHKYWVPFQAVTQ
ncbi:MAG: hypothetical protein U0361_22050 [Nitrospiraceae bacterium]